MVFRGAKAATTYSDFQTVANTIFQRSADIYAKYLPNYTKALLDEIEVWAKWAFDFAKSANLSPNDLGRMNLMIQQELDALRSTVLTG